MDTLTDILFPAPVDSQSPDLQVSTGLLLEEAEEDVPGVKLGKLRPSEEQDYAHKLPRKRAKPNTAAEQDNISPGEPPAPVLSSAEPGAGRWASYDETHLELLYNKLEIVLRRYNPSYLDADISFDISPKNPKHSSLPWGTFTVFIILKPPFPYDRMPHRVRALECIDTELDRALRHPAWRPQKMIYYILDEEHAETCDPDEIYTGGYWAEARRPLGGPQGFDYCGAFTRTKEHFSMAPSRRPEYGTLRPDWARIRFETDTKFILGGHTTGGREAQRLLPLTKASARKHGAGRAANRKPKQDSLRKKLVTKQVRGLQVTDRKEASKSI